LTRRLEATAELTNFVVRVNNIPRPAATAIHATGVGREIDGALSSRLSVPAKVRHDETNGRNGRQGGIKMKRSPQSGGISRRTFSAGLGAAGVLAGTAPFNIVRAQGAALKVGVLLPRSGYQAGIGQDCQRGVDIAGGLLKEAGYPALQIMNADTETNVDVARSRAEKLIADGAQLLTGAFDSGASTAIAQVAEQKGIPYVINIAAAPPITEQGYKFVFRNFPTAGMILGDAFKNQKEIFAATGSAPKSVVFMHVNDIFGMAM